MSQQDESMRSGRFGLSPWDTAAGTLLIQEAGGRIGTLAGAEYKQEGHVLAGTPKVYAALLEAFAPARSRRDARELSRFNIRFRARTLLALQPHAVYSPPKFFGGSSVNGQPAFRDQISR